VTGVSFVYAFGVIFGDGDDIVSNSATVTTRAVPRQKKSKNKIKNKNINDNNTATTMADFPFKIVSNILIEVNFKILIRAKK